MSCMARKAGLSFKCLIDSVLTLAVFPITSAKRMRECCGTLRCVEIGLGTVFCAAKRTRMRYGWLHYVERVLLAMLVFSFGT